MSVRTVDLRYMGTDYRIAEPMREQGAEIRPAGEARMCAVAACPRRFRPETKTYRSPGNNVYCLPCTLERGWLVPLEPVEEGQQAELAEQRAGVGQ